MSTLLYLLLGALAGLLVTRLLPRRQPYELIVSAPAAVVGAVLLSLPLGDQGPRLAQVAVGPAVIGALLGAGALHLLLGRRASGDGESLGPAGAVRPDSRRSARER